MIVLRFTIRNKSSSEVPGEKDGALRGRVAGSRAKEVTAVSMYGSINNTFDEVGEGKGTEGPRRQDGFFHDDTATGNP